MITAKAAREMATDRISDETYWVGKIDRKIKMAINDKLLETKLAIYSPISEELRGRLITILEKNGFEAAAQFDGEITKFIINWG